jgi:hypothetical protein
MLELRKKVIVQRPPTLTLPSTSRRPSRGKAIIRVTDTYSPSTGGLRLVEEGVRGRVNYYGRSNSSEMEPFLD